MPDLVSQDFELIKGKHKAIRALVTDENGAVVDVTSVSIEWRMSPRDVDQPHVLEKSTDTSPGGITIFDGPNGLIDIIIENDDLLGPNFTEKYYYHDATLKDSGGDKSGIFFGTIKLLEFKT